MPIAARALLCANAFRVHADMSGGLFEELRQLCAAAAEKRWLAYAPSPFFMRSRIGRNCRAISV